MFLRRGFDTFTALLAGLVAAPTRRTVCGIFTASGMSGVWHHSQAHRFFASSRWNPDQLGLVALGLVIGWLTPAGAPIAVAVDDTLFRRRGRKVYAACWAYDGSLQVAAGQTKLSRGNTFVVAAVVVELPFLERPIALPVLARLWRPGGPTKTVLARELIRLIARARRDRIIHVVADSAYVCKTFRYLPANVTLTGPLPPTPAPARPDAARAARSSLGLAPRAATLAPGARAWRRRPGPSGPSPCPARTTPRSETATPPVAGGWCAPRTGLTCGTPQHLRPRARCHLRDRPPW